MNKAEALCPRDGASVEQRPLSHAHRQVFNGDFHLLAAAGEGNILYLVGGSPDGGNEGGGFSFGGGNAEFGHLLIHCQHLQGIASWQGAGQVVDGICYKGFAEGGAVFFSGFGGEFAGTHSFVVRGKAGHHLVVAVENHASHIGGFAIGIEGAEGHFAGKSRHEVAAFRVKGQVNLLQHHGNRPRNGFQDSLMVHHHEEEGVGAVEVGGKGNRNPHFAFGVGFGAAIFDRNPFYFQLKQHLTIGNGQVGEGFKGDIRLGDGTGTIGFAHEVELHLDARRHDGLHLHFFVKEGRVCIIFHPAGVGPDAVHATRRAAIEGKLALGNAFFHDEAGLLCH